MTGDDEGFRAVMTIMKFPSLILEAGALGVTSTPISSAEGGTVIANALGRGAGPASVMHCCVQTTVPPHREMNAARG